MNNIPITVEQWRKSMQARLDDFVANSDASDKQLAEDWWSVFADQIEGVAGAESLDTNED